MVLLDSNVPMYLVGAAHLHKADAQRLLETAIAAEERLVADRDVLQEILNRYVAIGRPEAIQPAFDAVLGVVDAIYPIELVDVQRAKEVVFGGYALSARNAEHVAVMERHGIDRIMSFDSAFDGFPGVERLG